MWEEVLAEWLVGGGGAQREREGVRWQLGFDYGILRLCGTDSIKSDFKFRNHGK
jgi:hypothetical protein